MGAGIASTRKGAVEASGAGMRPARRGLLRAGGACLLVCGLIYIAGAALSIVIGPPPSGGEPYLRAPAGHAAVSEANFALWVLADVLLLPATLALYLALEPVARNAMLVAAALMVLFAVLDLAVTERVSLALVALARQYTAAASGVQRAAWAAAADHALATLLIATFLSHAVSSVGLLIIGIVMWRGAFGRLAAILGIAAAVEGILGGFYPVIPALALLLVPSLVAFGLWALLAGCRLWALARGPRLTAAAV